MLQSDLKFTIWTITVGKRSEQPSRQFYAYEDILQQVPYFRWKLAGYSEETKSRKIRLRDYTHEAFAEVLDLLSTGKCSILAVKKPCDRKACAK